VINLLIAIVIVLGMYLSLALAYLFFWAVVYLTRPAEVGNRSVAPKTRFACVVPAHNEGSGIDSTLGSLLAVSYPRELFDVVVIADNCTDATASVARHAGTIVYERRSDTERGKGFALRHAFQILLSKGYDAFVVIDADSMVDENFLSVMDGLLQEGHDVIQALNGIANPDATPLTYLFYVGNVLENHLFYEAKQRLGFPAVLRGNGMCFSHGLLERFPWTAFSVVEDTEYTINLIRAGVDIPFTVATKVLARQPETLEQAHSQRVRWAAGNMKITRGYAVRLIGEGMARKRPVLADIGASLLVMSKPVLIVVNLLMIGLAALNMFYFQHGGSQLVWALGLLAGMFVYLGLGAVAGGLDGRRLKRLIKTPVYLCWMLYVSLLGFIGYGSSTWVRTKRP
jgi:1,2-diacylglycerol 3-beta-glucosyltransferase